jgi:O-antigen/teichoic acid export membrane protein
MDLIFIPRFGAIGAAIANGGTQVLAVVVGLVYTKSILSSPFPLTDTARIYAAALLAMTPVLFASLTTAKLGYLLVVAFGAFVYIVALVAMGAVGSSEASFLRKNILTRLQAKPVGLIAVEKDSF